MTIQVAASPDRYCQMSYRLVILSPTTKTEDGPIQRSPKLTPNFHGEIQQRNNDSSYTFKGEREH